MLSPPERLTLAEQLSQIAEPAPQGNYTRSSIAHWAPLTVRNRADYDPEDAYATYADGRADGSADGSAAKADYVDVGSVLTSLFAVDAGRAIETD